jgi:hypothetical protein
MFKIEKKPFGIKLTFGEFILKAEMEQWLEESKKALAGHEGVFGVFVDMRTLKPLPTDSQEVMVKGQQLYKKAGMTRSVVILDNSITTMQFKRLAKESGIYAWERYIDASTITNWEKAGVDWIVSGTDPDL